jgi:predicted phage tail protein
MELIRDISVNLRIWQKLSHNSKRAIKALKAQGYTFEQSMKYLEVRL